MIAKTLFGVDFFDAQYGGIYCGRPVLVSGRKGTGKTIVGLQFLQQGLRQDERGLILSTTPAADLAILAEAAGFAFADDLQRGNLVFLEYNRFMSDYDESSGSMLPPESFEQLREIIASHLIQRVVLDSVLPWVAIRAPDRLNEHVFSFVRSFERLGVTTLMTMPKPVSPMALRLKKVMENIVPVSICLSPAEQDGRFLWQVVKHLGAQKLGAAVPYRIKSPGGLCRCVSSTQGDGPASFVPSAAAAEWPPKPSPSAAALKEAYAVAGWTAAAVPVASEAANRPEKKDVVDAHPAPEPTPLPAKSRTSARFAAVWAPQDIPTEAPADSGGSV